MSAVRRLFACALALVLFRPAAAQLPASSASGITVTRDIPYTADATGAYTADLYQPSGTPIAPAIVLIHGGSWRSGNKHELRRLATDLASAGYISFSIDYDIHPRSFPYSWQESRAAVQFLRDHATAYHLDPAHIAVLGTSAGGQLAALVALAPQGPDTSQTPAPPSNAPVPVAAAVLFNGGYNAHPKAWVLRRYLGGRCEVIPTVCDDASPDNHVHPGAPPIFVGHGNHDHLIPYSQATEFIARLQAAHDPVTPFVATGAGHSYWRKSRWYQPNLTAAEAFLASALHP